MLKHFRNIVQAMSSTPSQINSELKIYLDSIIIYSTKQQLSLEKYTTQDSFNITDVPQSI